MPFEPDGIDDPDESLPETMDQEELLCEPVRQFLCKKSIFFFSVSSAQAFRTAILLRAFLTEG